MASLVALNYFMPIIAFLLVFLVSYIFLKKAEFFSGNNLVPIFLSFAFSAFFIVNTSLVEFVTLSSSWITVFMVIIFFIMLILAFLPGGTSFLNNNKVSWVVVGLLLGFFLIAAAYVFNLAVNWDKIWGWFFTDWFGFVLLLVIAALVSWTITKKAGK